MPLRPAVAQSCNKLRLRSAFEKGCIKAADPLVGGMVNNKCGFPMAHGWTIYTHHGKSTVVGLLMSGSAFLASRVYIFDTNAHVYSSHKIFPDVFKTNGGTMAVQARPRPRPRPSPRPSPSPRLRPRPSPRLRLVRLSLSLSRRTGKGGTRFVAVTTSTTRTCRTARRCHS